MKRYKIVYDVTDELLKQALELDKQVFSKLDIGDFDLCKSWLKINNQIYTFLLYNNKLIGYINFIRITDDCFSKFIQGKMKDYKLNDKDILPFKKNEGNKCLFMSIAIAKEHRDTNAIIYLKKGFDKKLKKLKKQGVVISDTVIDCVSVDGVKFCIERLDAKYLTGSLNGKIYYTPNIYSKGRKVPNIKLELLNKKNLKTASIIQYQIFKKNWCGYCDYLKEVEQREKGITYNLQLSFVIKYHKKIVGIIGLYELKQYPNVIWLNWFAILPKYRRRGIGTNALFKIINIARTFKRKEFRLVTYEVWNIQAQDIYKKITQLEEPYTNKNDWQYAIKNGVAKIFSFNLFDKMVTKWNNKFIDLLSDRELHKNSIKKLKDDGLIN